MSRGVGWHHMLMVDDNHEDHLLLSEALEEAGLPYKLHLLDNGDLLPDYLRREGTFKDAPPIQLILLDLHMPGKSGRRLLTELKSSPTFRAIPVLIFTASWDEREIRDCYELGANAVMLKPPSFEGIMETLKSLTRFWFQTCALPLRRGL